jgi:hypothetical protein
MKNLLLLLTVLVSINQCIGQTDEKALEKAKDYINFKLTYWVLKEKAKSKTEIQKDFDSIRPTLESTTIDNADFNKLSGLIANKFNKVQKKVAEPVHDIGVRQFASYPPEDAAKKLIDACLNVLTTDYSDLKDTVASNKGALQSQIVPYLNQFVEHAPPVTDPPVPPPVIVPDTRPNNIMSLILNIVSVIAVIGFYLYFRKENASTHQKLKRLEEQQQTNRDAISRRRKEELETSWNKNSQNGVLNTTDIENAIINSDYFQKMAAEVQVLKKLLEQYNKVNKSSDEITSAMEKTDNKDVFYMTGPVNNYFPNSAKSIRKEGTVYKFTVCANKQEARFETHIGGGTPVSEIVKRNESYIKPACVEENVPDSGTRNIITKKSGLAILEGDKWVIKTKAVIQYE